MAQPPHNLFFGDSLIKLQESETVFDSSWESRITWTLTTNQPLYKLLPQKVFPTLSHNVTRPRREGDASGAVEITEAALVRDILCIFQGIDSKNIKMSDTKNCYKVEGKANLNKPLRDRTVRLAELGWLHNKKRKYGPAESRSFIWSRRSEYLCCLAPRTQKILPITLCFALPAIVRGWSRCEFGPWE